MRRGVRRHGGRGYKESMCQLPHGTNDTLPADQAISDCESLAHLRHTWKGWPVGNRLAPEMTQDREQRVNARHSATP